MRVYLESIGAWGEGFCNWKQLREMILGATNHDEGNAAPKPSVIPANERRRAPLSSKLAVEVCAQSVAGAFDPEQPMASVFCSGLGDTELTDYMCRELAREDKLLSPTKFHNSVHNAPAGYWTIAMGCNKAASAVAGLYESVSEALLEGLIQCLVGDEPVLLSFYDTPASSTLRSIYSVDQAFAVSFIVSSVRTPHSECEINWQVEDGEVRAWPEVNLAEKLRKCYETNISARTLALLEPIAREDTKSVSLPLSKGTFLQLQISHHT